MPRGCWLMVVGVFVGWAASAETLPAQSFEVTNSRAGRALYRARVTMTPKLTGKSDGKIDLDLDVQKQVLEAPSGFVSVTWEIEQSYMDIPSGNIREVRVFFDKGGVVKLGAGTASASLAPPPGATRVVRLEVDFLWLSNDKKLVFGADEAKHVPRRIS